MKQPTEPLTRRDVVLLNIGLVCANLLWSGLHVILSVPLRRGANPGVLCLYRETVGFVALAGVAQHYEGGSRPPVTRHLFLLFTAAGLIFAAMRWSLILGLFYAGPDIAAAVTPATPVVTLIASVLMRTDILDLSTLHGKVQVVGLILCSSSAAAMAFFKGPLLFGTPPEGQFAPKNLPAGVMWILLNTVVAALIQIVNARTLRSFPLLSTTAANTGMAVAWLLLGAAATAPRGAWGGDASMVAAVLYGGLVATGLNNVLMARANKALGPTVANLYMPLQPVTTAIIDYLTLGDAFYAANVLCGLGVIGGLVMVLYGKLGGSSGGAGGGGGCGAEKRAAVGEGGGYAALVDADIADDAADDEKGNGDGDKDKDSERRRGGRRWRANGHEALQGGSSSDEEGRGGGEKSGGEGGAGWESERRGRGEGEQKAWERRNGGGDSSAAPPPPPPEGFRLEMTRRSSTPVGLGEDGVGRACTGRGGGSGEGDEVSSSTSTTAAAAGAPVVFARLPEAQQPAPPRWAAAIPLLPPPPFATLPPLPMRPVREWDDDDDVGGRVGGGGWTRW